MHVSRDCGIKSKTPVMCIVQEGQISREAEEGLKAQISSFTRRAFGAPADIDWIVVAFGSGFTAAEPSKAVIASLHVSQTLKQSERAKLQRELSDICIAQTGRSAHEIVTSLR